MNFFAQMCVIGDDDDDGKGQETNTFAFISFLLFFYLSLFIYFVCSRCDVVLRAVHSRYAPYRTSCEPCANGTNKKETRSEKN